MNEISARCFSTSRPLTLIIAGAVLAIGLCMVHFGRLNADEGFYLLAARFVADGFSPYRDFGLTQPPGMPWVYSVLLEVFGWNLSGIRLASWSLMALSVVIGGVALVRWKGWWSASIFMTLLLGSPGWVEFAVKGKTYALAGVAVMVAAVAVVASGSPWVRWMVLLAAAALGVMTRLPMAVFFAIGWLGLMLEVPGWRMRVLGCGVSIVAALAMVWLGSAGAWEEARFWVLDFHRQVLSTRTWDVRWGGLLGMSPGVCCGLVAVCIVASKKRRSRDLWLAGAVVVAIAVNVGMPGGYAEYAAPLLSAGAFVIAFGLADGLRPWFSTGPRWRGVAVALALAAVGWLKPPHFESAILESSRAAAEFLSESVPADKWVVATMPEIPVAAGRKVPLELAMGKFALTESLGEVRARQVHMVTPDRLVELLEDPDCGAFVISGGEKWNFAWSMPRLTLTTDEAIQQIKQSVGARFEVAFTSPHFVVLLPRHDHDGTGD